MRGHDAVFGTGRAHADHFLRTQICRDEGKARDPDRNRMPRRQEVFAGCDLSLGQPADSKDKREIDDETDVVDRSKCQEASVSLGIGAHARFAAIMRDSELYRTASAILHASVRPSYCRCLRLRISTGTPNGGLLASCVGVE